MAINKKDVIKLLEKIATYLELKNENPFKISAYRKAAQALERDDRSLTEIEDFTKLQGVGKGTAAVILEFIENGESDTLLQLEKEVPAGLIPLLNLPGLGGKKLAKLYHELDIVDEGTLRAACEKGGEVQALKGFGKKTEEKIIEALNSAGTRPERLPVPLVVATVEKIEDFLHNIEEIQRFSIAGSMRRFRETVKDLDFIIATDKPDIVKEKLLQFEDRMDTIAAGDTKVSIVVQGRYDINVDFRLVSDKEFPTTLHHFTGSKDHNVLMRQLAKSQGKKISEYGVEDVETGKVKTFATEEAFYRNFGLEFIPPEIREGKDELTLAKASIDLVDEASIQADLHMHTTWSDGAQSLEEMVIRVKEKGYHFMAITDHSKFLKVANGLNEERLRQQRKEIEKVQQQHPDITILAGVEMDILPDGTLDFEDDFLQELDFVIASIHSSFQQPQEKIHERLLHALQNPHVDMIAHPTGRLLGKRDGYAVDVEWLIKQAAATNTILELNANPNRLDLSAEWVELAQEHGVHLAINTDAHNYTMLEDMTTGIGTARRGKLKKDTVVNTWNAEKFIEYLRQKEVNSR
ncbi:DNA polymerase X family [Gracilibacillus boraciitolerans JCM 21714]|uniref:DNA-directed DNA polymerase n=1 Tax=Gracilibacillus boraciitolerans JCM 21714 TaxID=1298598 RepID=W4VIX4_9BACI|nr:DNA polymerase/3'-5' exonuclease PolX [Gracilibacillus boraciitolerans]GAE92709.1 DNA polymerase X family [Gracilibacillus boraciitolerans JCM 21714]